MNDKHKEGSINDVMLYRKVLILWDAWSCDDSEYCDGGYLRCVACLAC